MKIVTTIPLAELDKMSQKMHPNLVKAVVDVNQEIVAVDAEYHVDLEQILLEQGSNQKDLWGINFHPQRYGTDDFVEYDSMINLRPSQRNESRYVEDEAIRRRIVAIVAKCVQP